MSCSCGTLHGTTKGLWHAEVAESIHHLWSVDKGFQCSSLSVLYLFWEFFLHLPADCSAVINGSAYVRTASWEKDRMNTLYFNKTILQCFLLILLKRRKKCKRRKKHVGSSGRYGFAKHKDLFYIVAVVDDDNDK